MPLPYVIGAAEYLANLATAFLAAPEDTDEETHLRKALVAACERTGADRNDLLASILNAAPVVREERKL